ncbi:carbohydrate kinase family protein [Pedobacter punctiformis]|uniref:Carbohydrate kinase n=1 Tax=Pedobacter punctiformis TaxID=3004097 RepID=A0ABT4L821_9SPHI|nr:carbohydrate kinase [Pedobacter sp. HCMS5-2]MCZ4244074.1 carbohydrate kinase [Pedobacter sp. HCMS5-2]
MSRKNNVTVICFGEVLWDNFPSGKKPGGAIMNVAYHLKNLGVNSHLISKIGKDGNGAELQQVLNHLGIDDTYVQIDEKHKTSTVEVHVGEDNEVTYEIVQPVAWDFITPENPHTRLVAQADALVYGSLSGRTETSRKTLEHLLELAPYRVMDVNLRAPHYNESYISSLLHKTDLLKLNLDELGIISNWFSQQCKTETDRVDLLQNKFNIPEMVVTKGGKGASYYGVKTEHHWPAYNIKVKDTVGSGDSFLAGLLSMKLSNEYINDTLDFAVALSAYITTQEGACPVYEKSAINRFMMKHKKNWSMDII